jgi:hypothetical protein
MGDPPGAAKLDPSSLAVQRDGGFLIAECLNNRVRRVAPDGRITTVAGVGPHTKYGGGKFAGDGGPAIGAHLACPADVAVTSDGGFVIADSATIGSAASDPTA